MIYYIVWFQSCFFVSVRKEMSGNKPERVERVGNFSPKEKADAWDKAGRGRPRPVPEGRSSYFEFN